MAERIDKARYGVPVELDAGADDQHAIADPPPVIEPHLFVIGQETTGRSFDPGGPGRNQVRLAAPGKAAVEHARAHHRPAGLIIMIVARFDDGEADAPAALEDAGGRGDPGAAAADDQDIIRGGIVSGDQCVRHRRQFFGAGARPAIAQHRAGEGVERVAHRLRIGIGHRARDYGDVREGEASGSGDGTDVRRGRLVILLAIGAVADDRAKALARGLFDIVRRQLRGGGKGRGQPLDIHDDPPWSGVPVMVLT